MTDFLSLLAVMAAIGVVVLLSRRPLWSRCRCGGETCTSCGRRR